VLLLTIGVSWWVRNSKYGLGLLAIRDDEDRALGLGVKTGPFKLVAYVISAFFIGMIGALIAYFIGSLYPPFAFSSVFDINVALMSFLGGIGTLVGPIVGAFLLEPLTQYITVQMQIVGLDQILFGSLLLAVILLLPEGIVPSLRKTWTRWNASRGVKSPVAGSREKKEKALLVKGGREGNG
jgi:ABC-type branched-subunit amino acid transport system permease subunit